MAFLAKTVVVIDGAVENDRYLRNAIAPEIEIVILDANQDGIEQIAEIFKKFPAIDALHIVAHGSPGCLYLGNSQLTIETIDRYRQQIQSRSLAHLFLYGCNVAAGDAGTEFIEKLHRYSGAEIAASTTPIGNVNLGGKGELDFATVEIESSLALSKETFEQYPALLGPPVNDSASTNEDNPLPAIDVLVNDNILGDAEVIIINQPGNGTAVANRNGTISYTPNPNFNGTDTITYGVNEDVNPTTANEDRAIVSINTPKTINVLFNDFDPQGDPLTVTLPGGATTIRGGSLTVNPDGTITYNPAANYTGTDFFTYQISDAKGNTSTATVDLDVRRGNPRSVHYLPPQVTGSTHANYRLFLRITTENLAGAAGRVLRSNGTQLTTFNVTANSSFSFELTSRTSDGRTATFNTAELKGLQVQTNSGEPVNFQLVQETENGQSYLTSKGYDALGTTFYAGEPVNSGGESNAPESHISVMAVEDGTQVTFTRPTGTTWNWFGQTSGTFSVTLNAGQTFVARADSAATGNESVTGALVQSTKPIAVSSGAMGFRSAGGAIDNGWDQLVPVERVGTEYIVVKALAANEVADIVATKNNTQVEINGSLVTTLQSGQVYRYTFPGTAASGTPTYIKTSEPSYVYQNSGRSVNRGEDDISLIPPITPSGRTAIRIRAPINGNVINVITATSAIPTLRMTNLADGTLFSLPIASAQAVPGRPDVSILSFAGPTSGGTLDAPTPKEFLVQSSSFLQVGLLAATSSGGGFGYLSGFGLGNIQATDDFANTRRNNALAIDVLANDYDAEKAVPTPGDLVISNFQATTAQGGTVIRINDSGVADPNGTRFLYTPPTGFTGNDSFSYSVRTADGLFGAQATVNVKVVDYAQATIAIAVNPVLDAPAIDLDRTDNANNNYQALTTGNGLAVPIANGNPDGNIFSDPDSAAEIASVSIGVTGVRDGANEILNVGGVLVPLAGDTTIDQTIAGIPLRLIVSGTGDADPNNDVVTITTPDGSKIPTAVLNSLFSGGVTYQNNLPTPIGGDRILTITASDGTFNSAPVTSTISVNADTDGDGVLNANDLDDDNDGIPDAIEQNGNPTQDIDGDGIIDSLDLDSDNDGITDFRESGIAANLDTNNDGRIDTGFGANGLADAVETAAESGTLNYAIADSNGDGVRDFQTIDSDGDGIPDIVEAGGIDADGDGRIDNPFADSNFNGLSDGLETTPLPVTDSDLDGIPNYRDRDTDNDGITDAIEQNIDTDGDGTPNYLDLDSDADGITDFRESGIAANLDTNFDGRIDSGFGANGLADAVETAPDSGALNYAVADSDGDGVVDVLDRDSDNDGITDAVEAVAINGDTDGDTIPDFRDLDSDGDGINDLRESGLTLALLSTLDTNNDGRIDSGFGANGLADAVETAPDSGALNYTVANTDGDGVRNFQDLDSDNDGILDSTEQAGDPNRDSDGDGVINALDLDSDNDGINDVVEAGGTDIDGNGIIDGFVDSNGNGWLDGLESSPLPVPDSDGDGTPDIRDLDSDNDGIPDLTEAGFSSSFDTDGNGVIDAPDTDGDGINDPVDGQAGFGDNGGPASNGLPTSDGDGTPNYRDLDSDGDGISDRAEAGLSVGPGTPDTNGDGQADVATDSDGDGIPDSIDSQTGIFGGIEDKDKDGVPDLNDLDDDNDGILDTVEQNGNPSRDTDGDGIIDSFDLDSDNDGITDIVEANGIDANGNGIVDGFTDNNRNGVDDAVEAAPLTPPDTDGDGIRDFQDRDSDNDGITDTVEADGIDANNDGILDGIVDSDRDGLADSVNQDLGNTPLSLPDNDGDAIRDYRDLDTDNDGRFDIVEVGGIDTNNDGKVDSPTDSNGDGFADTVDPKTGGVPLNPSLDADGNGLADRLDNGDNDSDGIPDTADLDDDNDGILDSSEPTADTDGDGIPDSFDLDSDNDGITDAAEAGGTDANGDGIIDSFVDANGNGWSDSVESAPLPVPDSDGDGIRDFQDRDSDNDGITDLVEAGGDDANGDGIVDNIVDSNGDGIADSLTTATGGTPLTAPDTDGDGLRDYRDRDSDNDGVTDAIEAGGTDANGDGIIDGLTDSNRDGISDGVTPGTGGTPLLVPDRDGDGNPDFQDLDSDGDGINDLVEVGGTDADNNGIIDNPTDSNGDGLADSVDPKTGGTLLDLNRDSDRDGIIDRLDPENLIPDGSFDSDGDGISNSSDLDDDNDGITDAIEENGNPRLDTDGDGIPDRFDLDSDNDGIADLVEANGTDANGDGRVDNFSDSNGNGWSDSVDPAVGGTPLPISDTDGDGVNDFQDTDSDNDGITDTNEAGGVDGNGDGRIDNLVDSNGDGITDVVNSVTGGTPLVVPDIDGDSFPDYQDLDSDNDGIADVVEAGGTDSNGDGVIDNFSDSNGDGLADLVDSKTGGTAFPVPDTDSDGVQDYRDSDSDNDGITDATEAGGVDTNGDGILDNLVDSNGDGIADSVLSTTGGTPLPVTDTDGDGNPDFQDIDSDGDGRFDLVEAGGVDADNNGIVDGFVDSNFDGLADTLDPTTGGVPLNPNIDSNGDGIPDRLDNGDKDGDGIPDISDLDNDNDGILDTVEQNGNPTRDTDGDGIPDNFDRDSDNDGITDVVEAGGTDNDGDGIIDGYVDTNSNGVADSVESAPLATPDTDGDGVRDFQDLDSDNDGVTDATEAGGIDANGDGINDGFRDSNRDGIADLLTVATGGVALLVPDSDGDGARDFRDIDSDGDGRPDILENGGTDSNGDGIVDGFVDSNGNGLANNIDPRTGGSPLFDRDSDNNGLSDRIDNGDRDGDGVPDTADLDDDNDGILDTVEQKGDPALDTDGDGIIDSFDLDSDNDGIADVVEAGGTDANGDGIIDTFIDSNGNGVADSVESAPLPTPDTDGDGVADFQDLDSDNDGVTDAVEAGGTDSNGDGAIDGFSDRNGDGIADSVSTTTGGLPLSLPDSDGDGAIDVRDIDSDGDGVPDLVESGGTDSNGDGIVDGFIDNNSDGLSDSLDPAINGGVPLNPNIDSDGNGLPDRLDDGDNDKDGIPDSADLDDDNDGILDTAEQNGDLNRDTDSDGIPDSLDLDSDNDGIVDTVEAGGTDANGDGIVDDFADADGNGVADRVDAAPLPAPDTDGDGVRDFQDRDSDNDGITDAVEAGGIDTNGDGIIDGFSDSNGDGIADSLTGTPLPLPDSDGDGVRDFLDLDSDGDGVPDLVESGGIDADRNGIVDGFVDRNGDGLSDTVDPGTGGTPLNPSLDNNGDGIPDRLEDGDRDNDGVPDTADLDDDNDGIPDAIEQNGNPNRDTDGDGIIDSFDLDSDNDGISDVVEAIGLDANGDGIIDNFVDANGNGWSDSVDPAAGGTPLLTPDNDGDGVRDFQDRDSDNDGLTDTTEAGGTDSNGDGIIDSFVDSNGDGLTDTTPVPLPDTDGDGVRDFRDRDSDNDGITDAVEGGGTDANGDGIADNFVDSNGDGLSDTTPLFVSDTDSDGTPDFRDIDSDGDGRSDLIEAGGIDANGDGRLDNPADTNGDGLADIIDSKSGGVPLNPNIDNDGNGLPDRLDNGDRDGDGISNPNDLDDDNDGILDTTEQNGNPTRDTDGDGIPDSFDRDSDNDGITDTTEAGGTDTDSNGIIDGFADTNGNGVADSADAAPLPVPDTDGDGVRDFQDLDSDNDGITDTTEAGGTDANGDGIIDGFTDSNRDGIADPLFPGTGGLPLSVPDADGDGVRDFRDLDSDGDGIFDLVENGGTDADNNGIVDGFADSDGNGLANNVDPRTGGLPLPDRDSDGNGLPDRLDNGDNDGDGITDPNDLDDDNDGILDTTEQNGDPTRDTDGDSIPDSFDLDSDNDGITDAVEAGGTDANGDGIIDDFVDSDRNGVADSVDATPVPVPDTDGDGIADFQDRDSDNDGITDAVEAGGNDINRDGIIDGFVDSDRNGIADSVDAAPLPVPDSDGDGVRDFRDLDSDGDGRFDLVEAGGTDADGDGRLDNLNDRDGDGLPDPIDPKTGGTPLPLPDSDGDGIPDFQDSSPNAATQAVNDRGKTRTNTPIFLNVLANDIANENEILTLIAVTQGLGGTVTINDNGTPNDPNDDFLVYTPNSGFAGNDSFTYTVRDSLGNESTATVNVSVRVPSPANDDSTATLPNEAVSISVLANDGRGLRISAVSNGANGTVTINDNGTPNDPSDDFLVYTPNPGFEGDDEFEYTAVDAAGNSYTALVNVKVSASLPLAGDDDIFTAPGDDVFINVLGNDKDPNRQPLRIVSVSPGLRGTATIDDNGTPDDPTDDRILYAPNDLGDSVFSINRAGGKGLFSIGGNLRSFTDSFSYTVSDPDGNLSTANVNVTVDPEVRLKFTLTGNQAGFVNEVGFFYVDDENGAINGIAPGQEGYIQAALSEGRVVFSSLSQTSQLFGGNPTRIIDGFRTDQLVNFFLVQDGTVDNVLARIQAGQTPSNVFFATAEANEGSFNHLEVGDLTTGGFTFNWEDRQGGGDRDFNDLALNVEVTDEPVPIGNGLQGNNQQELLDITDFAGQSLQAQVSITREASYSNSVGLYRLEDANGTVRDPITGALLTPGQAGYTEAAKANSVAEFDSNTNSGTVALEGGSFYAPYIIANSGAQTYFPFLAANVNGVDHLRLLGDNTFGYEDLVRGGDFNDAVIKVEFTPIA